MVTNESLGVYFSNNDRGNWKQVFNDIFTKGYKLDDERVDYLNNFIARSLSIFTGEVVFAPYQNILRGKQLNDGVNLIGYIRSEHGLGEASRLTAKALMTTGIKWNGYDFEVGNNLSKGDHDYDKYIKTKITNNISIFNINADQMSIAKQHLPVNAFDGYKVGIWYYELTKFPKAWYSAFNLVDEIWAPTKFIQNTLEKDFTCPSYLYATRY